MLVSTFELLVKPQLPREVTPPFPPDVDITRLSRIVIQGYFLTLANVTSESVALSLAFTSLGTKTATEIIDSTYLFLDVDGTNRRADLDPPRMGDIKLSYSFLLPAFSTGLFILQPDVTKEQGQLVKDSNFELRGYVEINVSSTSTVQSTTLLLTPEHRGTFFRTIDPAIPDPQLDQTVYSLPTASGGSLFVLKNQEQPQKVGLQSS